MEISSYYLPDTVLPENFINKEFIFDLFFNNYGNRDYITHLCNKENTKHMYKIIKRFKKNVRQSKGRRL